MMGALGCAFHTGDDGVRLHVDAYLPAYDLCGNARQPMEFRITAVPA